MSNSQDKTHGKILIVDDEDIVHITLNRLLSSEGYVIDSAFSGEEALSKINPEYDLLISDIRMPEMDGIELLREIRKREIPLEVIMLTGYASMETSTIASNYGVREYLNKPIEDINLFRQIVRDGVKSAQLARQNHQVFEAILSGKVDSSEFDKSWILPPFISENKDVQMRLLHVIHDSIVILDTKGTIMFANVNFAKLLDKSYKDILGVDILQFIAEEDGTKYKDALNRLSKGEVGISIQASLNIDPNKTSSVLINLTPMYHKSEYQGIALVITDITEHLKIKEKLELFGNLVESAQNDMIFIIKNDGQILECNELARKTFDYSQNEINFRYIWTLLNSELDEWSGIMEYLTLNSNWHSEIIAITKNNKEFPCEIFVSRSKSELDPGENVICFMHDITQRKMMEEIQLENVRQAHASKAKNEFIAVMNHEMRTPLNSIIGFTSLIKQKKPGDLNEVQEKFIDNIFNSSKHLLNIVDNILSYIKIEEGKLELNYEKISVHEVLNEVLDMVKVNALQKNVDIQLKMDPDIEYFEADRVRFIQILFNLLDNAVKFSKQGGKVVVLSAKESDNCINFSVTDTGIGVKDKDLDRIFEMFYQADSSSTRKYNGTGLGLTITKQLVELHGGTISVKSKYGEGSTFTFSIPIKAKQIN